MYSPLICPNCGHDRNENLKVECPACRSRSCFWGYRRPHECRDIRNAIVVIATIITILFALGLVFYFNMNALMMGAY